MRCTGLGERSSRSASVCASARPAAGLWPPSSHSSEPGFSSDGSGPEFEPLHACRPARGRQTLLDRPFIQRDAGKARAQLQRRGDRGAGVDDLVAPNEHRQRQVEELCLRLHDKPAALLEGIELLAPDHERRAAANGFGADHVLGLWLLLRNDRRHTRAQDAGLLVGDLGECRAQLLGMIHRDRRDDRKRRPIDDVGRIEPTAEPHLEQKHIGRLLGKCEERRRRRDLELGDVVAAVGRLRAHQHVDELLLADRVRLAVGAGELDAFVEAHEMRGSIDMHACTRSLQHGLEVGRDRSLAVGAGDVHDRRQALVRIAELGEQALDPPQ